MHILLTDRLIFRVLLVQRIKVKHQDILCMIISFILITYVLAEMVIL